MVYAHRELFTCKSGAAGPTVTRRDLLAGLAAYGCAVASTVSWNAVKAAEHATVAAIPASEALERLKEGNRRFMQEHAIHDHANRDWRRGLVGAQHPFAVIVGCSDSRVPTELVFDQGFGDLFVIRNAGNLIATDVLASIEYAVMHLQTPLVLILGHEGCGAVTAALQSREVRDREPLELQSVLHMIEVAVSGATLPAEEKQRVTAAVEFNVQWGLKQLNYLAAERRVAALSSTKFVGAVYELQTGNVRFLN